MRLSVAGLRTIPLRHCTVILVTLIVAFRSNTSEAAATSEEKLIGWQGDTWLPRPAGLDFIETISWSPRAVLWHGFISDAEARHIIQLGQVTMRPSTVVGDNGSSVLDPYRTSYGTFLSRQQDTVIAAIEERVARWTHLPLDHQEDMQVLRYANGQKYDPHEDSLENDTPRLATVLIYLTTPEEGGETVFSSANSRWANPDAAKQHGAFSKCAQQGGGVAVKARRGDALLFWSITPDSKTEDHTSEHAGCPVLRGVKWSATKWIHSMPFASSGNIGPDPGLCEDVYTQCAEWAAAGECEKNSGYMVGTSDAGALGVCRRTCAACEACEKEDQDCYVKNRQAAGVLVFNKAELDD